MTFWPPKQVKELQGLLQEPNHEKANLLVLDRTSHGYWNKCLFALRPLEVDSALPSLRLQFLWLNPVRTDAQVLDYTENKAANGSLCDNRDADSRTSRNIQSGDVLLITTRENKTYPLPDHRLLELQWHLQRAARAAAGAGFLRLIFRHDRDSAKVPASSNICIDFNEAELGPPTAFEPSPHFSEYLINSARDLGIIRESDVQFWRQELISPMAGDETISSTITASGGKIHRTREATTSDYNSQVRTIRLTRRFLTFATHRVVGLLHAGEWRNSTRSLFHDERYLRSG